jgi:hypothetical protein
VSYACPRAMDRYGGTGVDIAATARHRWCYDLTDRANVGPEITLSGGPWTGLGRRS